MDFGNHIFWCICVSEKEYPLEDTSLYRLLSFKLAAPNAGRKQRFTCVKIFGGKGQDMEFWLWTVVFFLFLLVIALVCKIVSMRRSMKTIEETFEEILNTETNCLITVSSRDRCLCSLADSLNRQLRILRKERHRFQQGDRSLKEAVTNLSHDIRTPLTAICGYLDLLENEEQSGRVSHYLEIIRDRSKRLKELTEELFYYALVSSRDPQTWEREDVILNQVLEMCIADCYIAFQEHHIIPEIQIPDQEVHRQLNKNITTRIYENVISNAIKYSDGDLHILLSETGEVVFENHASNLSEVQVERLFERFYTVEDVSYSTGLGLAVAKTMTEQMGGEIQVRHQDGIIRVRICFAQ